MGGAKADTDDVARLLGLKKGSLRFVPHGATSKAHVLLRRVEASSDDSSEEEGGVTKPTVYFSLFAAKRIEVKPGKELLLAITTEGPLKDQAVVLTGQLASDEDDSDPEDSEATHVAEEDDHMEASMPPKMRKSWYRREDVPAIRMFFILPKPRVSHSR
jgi:hypothetical protein